MYGLSLRIVNASYMKSLFVSLNCLTGHVFCCRSSKVEFCWCLSLKCSLIAPSLQCCSSLLLIVFLVMPIYEDVRSSQSSCGQVNLYKDHDLERLKHQQNSTLELLQQNTCPVKQLRDTKRLFIYEALTILKERPFINRQKDNFINPLKLYSRTTTLNQSQPKNSTSTNHTYSLRSRQQ